MNEHILSELEGLIEQEAENFTDDFTQIEKSVKKLVFALGNGLIQRLVDREPNGYKGCSILCGCGKPMKFVNHRKRRIHTVFGWITVQRAYYHCANCGKGFAPYDKESGFGSEHLSPALAQACCLLSVDDSFEQTRKKIELLFGEKVDDDTVQKVVHQAGTVAYQQNSRQLDKFKTSRMFPAAQAEPERLYVSVDGTTVHEADGWHEAKIGCINWEDKEFTEHKRYVGRFENSETFGWHIWLEACKCGLRQAKEGVYLGDGAPWIRNEHHRQFGTATFIIDWLHASEHVWDCGKKLFGEGSQATEDWGQKRLKLLWQGRTKRLIDEWKEQYNKGRGYRRQAGEALMRYICNNEQQMRYDVFRAKGYKIGSGAVDGACKYVVGKRLKQSGMIWRRQGSSAVLALRIEWLNGGWEQLWKNKPLVA